MAAPTANTTAPTNAMRENIPSSPAPLSSTDRRWEAKKTNSTVATERMMMLAITLSWLSV